jgi:hypothetical protein
MRRIIALLVAGFAVWFVLRYRHDLAALRDRPADERAAAADTAIDPASAPREMSMTTEGGEVVLALRADSVVMRLSDSTLAEVRAETDTGDVEGDPASVAARLERLVKSGVQKALSKEIAVSVDRIEEIRYEDGRIVMRVEKAPKVLNFESVKVGDNRPVLASFPPDDARRFVAAVRAAKARRE